MVERLKIKVAATAIGTAGAMVASRVVATAPRIAAVGPCAQSARIQNPLTKKTARTPVHSAPTGSFAWVKRIGREAVLGAEAVEHVVLDAVVDHRVHLHQTVEGQPRRLQQQFQILEDAPRLARHRPVLALAALRVDRNHAEQNISPPARIAGLW